MDDLLDLSPIEQELEALTAIYLDELKIHRSENGQNIEEVELLMHPATGNDTTKQFVRMNLVFQPGCQYPDEVPEIVIRNPRGLGEEELVSLVEDMRKKASECVGEVMLYTLIEMAKESLTEGNIPHCPCVVCLEHFQEDDLFHRTACYHYFHNYCLHKYLEHSRHQVELDKIEARQHRHLNPEDEMEEVHIICPVCRNPMDEDSLAVYCSDAEEEEAEQFVIPPNIREQQLKMAELYEIQKSKGAIIDVEWEKNKFLVNPEERVAIPAKVTNENASKQNDSEEAGTNEMKNNSQTHDKNQGRASRKWGSSSSDHNRLPRHNTQRYRDENYSKQRRDNYYNNHGRKGGHADFRDKSGSYVKSGSARNREDAYNNERQTGNGNKIRKAQNDATSRACLSSNEGPKCSLVTEEAAGVAFVNSKHKLTGHSEQEAGQRDGDSSESGRRGGRSEGGNRELLRRGRGRGGRVGSQASYEGSYVRSGRGHNSDFDSHLFEDRADLSRRGSSRVPDSNFSNVRDGDRRKDEKNSTPPRSGGNPRNRRGGNSGRDTIRDERGGSGARGRGGFRRDGAEKSSKGEDCTTTSSSNSDRVNRNLEHRNSGFGSRGDNHSEKKRDDDGYREERQQRHREYRGHDQYRHFSGRGGRGNESNRQNRDGRRGQEFGNGERGGGGHRSDQRGSSRSGRGAGGPRDEEEDDEEGRRREMDLKNLEINRRWRELNFGRQVVPPGQEFEGKKERGFGIVDDDVTVKREGNDNDHSTDEEDDDIRNNPNYNDQLYTVGSSDSEEDWGKESDPFTFERMKIRPEQFEEYSKYKTEQLTYFAEKVEKRAEEQNSTRAEQQRMQREQHQRGQREQRARLEQNDTQSAMPSESLSVLDRFKLEQEKKKSTTRSVQFERDEVIQKSGAEASDSSCLNIGNGNKSSSNEEICKDADFYKRKAGLLPNRNKVEGIEWIGVREHDDCGDGSFVDSANSCVNASPMFEDSWRRREEKRKQKQSRMKDKIKKGIAEKKEDDLGVGDERLEIDPEGVTRVRSRRREKEQQHVRKNFVTNREYDNCYSRSDNVNKQSFVPSNGITQVSSSKGNNQPLSEELCDQASNLQRKSKPVKPLDLRKKMHSVNVSNDSASQISDHNGIENLVGKFPSLLKDVTDESINDSEKRSALKNNQLKGARGDTTCSPSEAVQVLPSSAELDYVLAGSNSNSKILNSKTKPKPLDFRKNSKKGF